jgi:hypothetical protein
MRNSLTQGLPPRFPGSKVMMLMTMSSIGAMALPKGEA